MRSRYRFYACPEGSCPKLRSRPGRRCPEHDVEMVEVILRRETEAQQTKEAADKVRDAGKKVAQAGGDPFGGDFSNIFKGMAGGKP
jgi:hypothetical protein